MTFKKIKKTFPNPFYVTIYEIKISHTKWSKSLVTANAKFLKILISDQIQQHI